MPRAGGAPALSALALRVARRPAGTPGHSRRADFDCCQQCSNCRKRSELSSRQNLRKAGDESCPFANLSKDANELCGGPGPGEQRHKLYWRPGIGKDINEFGCQSDTGKSAVELGY